MRLGKIHCFVNVSKFNCSFEKQMPPCFRAGTWDLSGSHCGTRELSFVFPMKNSTRFGDFINHWHSWVIICTTTVPRSTSHGAGPYCARCCPNREPRQSLPQGILHIFRRGWQQRFPKIPPAFEHAKLNPNPCHSYRMNCTLDPGVSPEYTP